ncbi:hypothetical protein DFJ73DRAFT_263469 [Zopfochytrium polystomum]|nr:hypothetical protein DFJ73DRAFT_263469 [Zopfochytrium polystomum]
MDAAANASARHSQNAAEQLIGNSSDDNQAEVGSMQSPVAPTAIHLPTASVLSTLSVNHDSSPCDANQLDSSSLQDLELATTNATTLQEQAGSFASLTTISTAPFLHKPKDRSQSLHGSSPESASCADSLFREGKVATQAAPAAEPNASQSTVGAANPMRTAFRIPSPSRRILDSKFENDIVAKALAPSTKWLKTVNPETGQPHWVVDSPKPVEVVRPWAGPVREVTKAEFVRGNGGSPPLKSENSPERSPTLRKRCRPSEITSIRPPQDSSNEAGCDSLHPVVLRVEKRTSEWVTEVKRRSELTSGSFSRFEEPRDVGEPPKANTLADLFSWSEVAGSGFKERCIDSSVQHASSAIEVIETACIQFPDRESLPKIGSEAISSNGALSPTSREQRESAHAAVGDMTLGLSNRPSADDNLCSENKRGTESLKWNDGPPSRSGRSEQTDQSTNPSSLVHSNSSGEAIFENQPKLEEQKVESAKEDRFGPSGREISKTQGLSQTEKRGTQLQNNKDVKPLRDSRRGSNDDVKVQKLVKVQDWVKVVNGSPQMVAHGTSQSKKPKGLTVISTAVLHKSRLAAQLRKPTVSFDDRLFEERLDLLKARSEKRLEQLSCRVRTAVESAINGNGEFQGGGCDYEPMLRSVKELKEYIQTEWSDLLADLGERRKFDLLPKLDEVKKGLDEIEKEADALGDLGRSLNVKASTKTNEDVHSKKDVRNLLRRLSYSIGILFFVIVVATWFERWKVQNEILYGPISPSRSATNRVAKNEGTPTRLLDESIHFLFELLSAILDGVALMISIFIDALSLSWIWEGAAVRSIPM